MFWMNHLFIAYLRRDQ